jgi:hypothetical protein
MGPLLLLAVYFSIVLLRSASVAHCLDDSQQDLAVLPPHDIVKTMPTRN